MERSVPSSESKASVVKTRPPRLTPLQRGQLAHLHKICQETTAGGGEIHSAQQAAAAEGTTSVTPAPDLPTKDSLPKSTTTQDEEETTTAATETKTKTRHPRDALLHQIAMVQEIQARLVARGQAAQQQETVRGRQEAARQGLYECRSHVLRLIAIQEAVDGGYDLPSYDHYVQHFGLESSAKAAGRDDDTTASELPMEIEGATQEMEVDSVDKEAVSAPFNDTQSADKMEVDMEVEETKVRHLGDPRDDVAVKDAVSTPTDDKQSTEKTASAKKFNAAEPSTTTTSAEKSPQILRIANDDDSGGSDTEDTASDGSKPEPPHTADPSGVDPDATSEAAPKSTAERMDKKTTDESTLPVPPVAAGEGVADGSRPSTPASAAETAEENDTAESSSPPSQNAPDTPGEKEADVSESKDAVEQSPQPRSSRFWVSDPLPCRQRKKPKKL
jgi:hypothetical protein